MPWPKKITAITLFVEDLDATARFYRDVFAVPSVFADDTSAAFEFDGTIVNLLTSGSAPELIEPAPVASAGEGARAVLTITVSDVDGTCDELERRGVEMLNGPLDRPWGVRTAAFADPAGHVWEVAQPIAGDADAASEERHK